MVCLTSCLQPLPKLALHKVWSSASFFNFQHPLLCWKSSSSCLLPLLRLYFTSVFSHIFSSITCFRRQFLRKIRKLQLVFLLFVVCNILFSSVTLRNISLFLTRSVQSIFPVLVQHRQACWLKFWTHLSVRSQSFDHPEAMLYGQL